MEKEEPKKGRKSSPQSKIPPIREEGPKKEAPFYQQAEIPNPQTNIPPVDQEEFKQEQAENISAANSKEEEHTSSTKGPPIISHIYGNIFQSDAELLIVPIGPGGTATSNNLSSLNSIYNIPEIPQQAIGSISFQQVSHTFTKYLAFATSGGTNGTPIGQIENIANDLADWINDHPTITTVAIPLIGAGAGKLPIREVYPVVVKKLLDKISTGAEIRIHTLIEDNLRKLDNYQKAFFRHRVSSFDSDTVEEKEDQLDITFDVDSFSYLIANHNVKPPLSIGLFGLWGSGKSFFMQKMYEKIEVIQKLRHSNSENEDIVFCKNIVQIKFNAWYYVDTNLWASLVTKIFESIGDAIGLLTEEEKNILALEETLEGKKDQLREVEEERSNLQKQLNKIEVGIKLEEQVKGLEDKELKEEKQNLLVLLEEKQTEEKQLLEASRLLEANLRNTYKENKTRKNLYEKLESTKQLIKESRQNKYDLLHLIDEMNSEIEAIENERAKNEKTYQQQVLNFIVDDVKNTEAFKAFSGQAAQYLKTDDIKQSGQEVQAFVDEIVTLKKDGFSLYRKLKNFSWGDIGILLVFLAIILFGTYLFSFFKTSNLNFSSELLALGGAAAAFGSWLTKYLGIGWKYLKDLRALTNHVQDYQGRLEKIKTQKLANLQEQQARQTQRLQRAKNQLHEYQLEVAEIENNIEKLRRGESISTFIEKKMQSDDYQKYLGLISLIRSDFNQLSTYIKEITGKIEEDKNIDRIVLYIDDLDRCPPEKVVEVLQAIHLLLSFPLFVVVVGVDSRWISKSLISKYGYMISPFDQQGKRTDISLQYEDGASPYDYLEKIFQIPFRLTPIEDKGKESYIHSLISHDLQKELNEQDVGEDTGDGTEELTTSTDQIETITPQTNRPAFQPTAENLIIGQKDFDLIKLLIPILGSSPRAVKRFVNIYRLIKANAKWELIEMDTEEKRSGVLLLLAIIIGSPTYAPYFFKTLQKAGTWQFNFLLNDIAQKIELKEMELSSKAMTEFEALEHFFSKSHFGMNANDPLDIFNNLKVDDLNILGNLVSRFSFRVED